LAQAARSERIKQFMQHLFDNDGPAGPSIELHAIDILDRGAQEARRLDREPAIQGELFETLGQSYEKLGKYNRAESLLRSALPIQRAAYGDDSKQFAESLVSLASVLGEEGKSDEALELIRKGSAILSRRLPLDDVALASSQMTMGRVLASSAEYKEAIDVFNRAIPPLSRPDAPASDLFLALDGLGTAYFEDGQFALAQSTYERALALGERIYDPSNPLLAEEIVNLGSVQFALQNFPRAERFYRAGLDATRAWYGPDHAMVATESRLLGQTLAKEGRNREAEIFLRQALAIHERLFGSPNRDAIQDLNALGFAAEKQGRVREAEVYFTRTIRLEEALPHKDALLPMAINNLADLKRDQKQYAAAEELGRRAVQIARQMLPPTHLYTGVILLGLGKTLVQEKRFSEAQPYLVNAYSVLSKQGNPAMPKLQEARGLLKKINQPVPSEGEESTHSPPPGKAAKQTTPGK
jgi:tetratricopeptide (TPR) repeat protein